MSGKVRVHELANQLGLTSQDLLSALQEQGEFVKSVSSTVEAPVARRMRELVASGQYTRRLVPSAVSDHTAPTPRPGPSAALLLPEEEESQVVTAREAWAVVGVKPATIRQWVSRGYLRNVGYRGRAALYDRGDLEKVRRRTQARANASPYQPRLGVPRQYSSRLITTAEAAALVGVSPSTVRSWVTRGHLVPVRRSRRGHMFTTGSVLAAGWRTVS